MPNNRRGLGYIGQPGQVLVQRPNLDAEMDWENPTSPLVSDTPWTLDHNAANFNLLNIGHLASLQFPQGGPGCPTFTNINANIAGVSMQGGSGSDMLSVVTFTTQAAIAVQTKLFDVTWANTTIHQFSPIIFWTPSDDATAIIGEFYNPGPGPGGTFGVSCTGAFPNVIATYTLQYIAIGG